MRSYKLLILGFVLTICTPTFAQIENVAKEVLTAYKNRDIELLKKHASGFFANAITDTYFEDKRIQDDLKAVDNWDGEIREIRYKSGDMMGETVHIASLYFADVPDGDELYTVVLSSLDKQKWVMFAGGLVVETKEEFNKMSLTLDSGDEENAETVKKATYNFSTEMANGEISEKVTEQKIVDCINMLDDDNFFVILNKDDDFMQAAYSDKGFTVQYSEDGQMLEAKEYFTKDQTVNILKKYFSGDNNWKEGQDWITVEY